MEESLITRWKIKEQECGIDGVTPKMICIGTDFLPDTAAPCLSFKEAAHPILITDAFGSPSDWSEHDRQRLIGINMIGSDGNGNPIGIELKTGKVLLLDHEDKFYTIQFINNSIRQLGECLLAYMGEHESKRLHDNIQLIDPEAIIEKTFWWYEIKNLESSV